MTAAEPRRGIRLVKRLYGPRIAGLGLGFVLVAGGLFQIGAPGWAWALLVFDGLLWPHVAYHWALRSRSPYHAEHRNLLIDAAAGGFWVVAMGFNLLPSVLVTTMLSMNGLAVGGLRLFGRGLLAGVVGGLLAWPLLGGRLVLASNLNAIIAAIPFMVAYPLIIGLTTYRLSQQLAAQKRELEALSQRDALSGLYSRGFWQDRLTAEFRRALRHRRPTALLLADIDHFKRINDSHGHLFGDHVIRSVGALLGAQVRKEDVAGRYGGEEFALILPESTTADAQRVGERIRQALSAVVMPGPDRNKLTISIGIAAFTPELRDPSEWLNRADQALYQAKRSGRDCIRVFEPASAP